MNEFVHPYVDTFIIGHPKPKGSMRAFVPKGSRKVVVREQVSGSKPWRDIVALHLIEWTARGAFPIESPVEVRLHFRVPKPKTSKRKFPTSQRDGDIDKLTRNMLDAMVDAGILRDDCYVVRLLVTQDYTEPHTMDGVRVLVMSRVPG